MARVRIKGADFCEVCNKSAELTEDGWVHKQDGTPLCHPQPQQVPLKDYLVPTQALRDKFAMAALTGMIASDSNFCHRDASALGATLADRAYVIADAMIRARVK